MTEKFFAEKIRELGGTAYLVGGAVRDKIRGVAAHDKDYCITGVREENFTKKFPRAEKFGKSFPVYNLLIDNVPCEVAFARTEKKDGEGYHGFKVQFDPSVTIEKDLYRRDTTINAMAIEILTGEVIDPFNGREDTLNGKIRAVSKHFVDDPIRALRAARQSAQFNFEICEETFDAMKLCAKELADEPGERIFSELFNALKTDRPSVFFRNLARANLLEITFPEVAQLCGKTQPAAYHPEGDAYEHTLNILDEVSRANEKPAVRFAAMAHDFGKGTTPEKMLPHHYFHEQRGLKVLEKMAARINLPNDWRKFAALVIKEHMRAPLLSSAGKIVDLLIKLNNAQFSIKDFNDIIRADHKSLPPYLERAEFILEKILKVGGKDAPPELSGKKIGEWIRDERIRQFVKIRNDL